MRSRFAESLLRFLDDFVEAPGCFVQPVKRDVDLSKETTRCTVLRVIVIGAEGDGIWKVFEGSSRFVELAPPDQNPGMVVDQPKVIWVLGVKFAAENLHNALHGGLRDDMVTIPQLSQRQEELGD